MHRRHFLAAAGSAVVAGCNQGEDDPTTTTTTTTTTPEPPQRPTIDAFNLVYQWQQYGDAVDAAVSAATPGLAIPIAYRYTVDQQESGQLDNTQQLRVFDSDGNRVGINSAQNTQLTDSAGESTWENALFFDSRGWGRGEYTAELVIQDSNTDTTSQAARTAFELTQPLNDNEIQIAEVDAPDQIRTRESYQARLIFESTASRDGGFLSTFSARTPQTEWTTYDQPIGAILPAGETNDWQSNPITFSRTGQLIFRIDRINETWNLEITE